MLHLTARRSLASVCIALAFILLPGCGKNPQELIASAKSHIEQQDYKAASIELRSALQKNPNLPEARYLLGVALTQTMELPAAEKELRKAAELGYDEGKVLPALARTMLKVGQPGKVITEFGNKQLSEPAAAADLLAALGDAYLVTGKRAEAADAYGKALAAQPSHAMAKLGQAKLAALERELARADQIASSVAAESPARPEAWTLKAQIALASAKPEDAVANYRKALEVAPADLDARLALGSLLLSQGEEEAARREADAMVKLAANDPRTKFLEAQLAFKRRSYAEARDLALQVLRVTPAHIPSLRIAGASHFFLGNDRQAQDQLHKVVQASRADLMARRLLIGSYLRSGDLPRAKRALNEGLELTPKDPGLLVLSGEISVAERDLAGAMEDYEAALSGGEENPALMVRLGQLHLAAGESSEALKILESASAASDDQYQSDLLLVLYYLNQGKLDDAVKWIEKIEKKQPQDPVAPTLRGAAHLASRDESAARASFEKALQLRPAYAPALVALARLDLRAGNPTAAEQRFQTAVEKEPGNEGAALAYAALLTAEKAPAQKRKDVLARLVQAEPRSVRGRLALVAALMEAGEAQKAVTTAQEGLATDPENALLLRAAGAAQLAAGDYGQAVASFSKLAGLQPQSPVPQLLIAFAHSRANDSQRTLEALERALKIRPDFVPAQVVAARLHFRLGNKDATLAIARDIQRQRPEAPGGYLLEADVLRSDKRWSEADRLLKNALDRAPAPTLAATRHSVLLESGQPQRANELATQWLVAHPKDATFRTYLAERAVAAEDYAEAAKQYQAALSIAPNDPALLNNVGWVTGKLKDPRAIQYAEKAFALAPDSPAVLDTLGWLLVENGQVARGTEMLRKAVDLAPRADKIRLNLAKALIRSGDKSAGRRELELLAKKGEAFSGHREVQEMLESL